MKLPRDAGDPDLAKVRVHVGYRIARQTGSHLRLTHAGPSEHHLTIRAHSPLKTETLAAALAEAAAHLGISRKQLLDRRF